MMTLLWLRQCSQITLHAVLKNNRFAWFTGPDGPLKFNISLDLYIFKKKKHSHCSPKPVNNSSSLMIGDYLDRNFLSCLQLMPRMSEQICSLELQRALLKSDGPLQSPKSASRKHAWPRTFPHQKFNSSLSDGSQSRKSNRITGTNQK